MSDNLKVAKECGIEFDVVDVTAGGRKEAFVSEQQLEAYTSRILASQQAAHEAEIARLESELLIRMNDREAAKQRAGNLELQLSAANAACAMKDEALKFYMQDDFTHRCDKCGNVESIYIGRTAEAAVSASPQQAVEWERKQIEPLMRRIAELEAQINK